VEPQDFRQRSQRHQILTIDVLSQLAAKDALSNKPLKLASSITPVDSLKDLQVDKLTIYSFSDISISL
jgi:hypothetical protein